jgi:biopolymer transport protein TolQ
LPLLGSFAFALQLQAESGTMLDGSRSAIVGLLVRSSPIAKLVLLTLALFSIVSWSVILFKLWTFARAERQTRSFLDVFRRSTKFSEVQAVCHSLAQSPLVGLFQAGYTELTAQLRQGSPVEISSSGPPTAPGRPVLKSVAAVDRALIRAAGIETNKLEHWVPFLATTASITPFIGLFGTVWGIMTAFDSIGQTGSTSLGVVAPGIAEALVTTAAGLFAAIPAVLFYNYLTQRVRLIASGMDDFGMEFLNIAERNFT